MSGVPFVDSAGLGALIGGIRRARELGGDVAVACDRPTLVRVLRPPASTGSSLWRRPWRSGSRPPGARRRELAIPPEQEPAIPPENAGARQARVLIVVGKGGVGKTTVSAALGRAAAMTGRNALVVEIEGKGGLAAAFGHPGELDYREVVLHSGDAEKGEGEVRGRTLRADEALVEYLEDHAMGRLSKRLLTTGAIDVVATAVPGIKDILVLGKVKQLERENPSDLIVLDAPASGHAISFLGGAAGLLDAVRSGPIRAQAQDVVDLLTDENRTQVLIVTLAEEMPVNEAVEVADAVEDKVGAALGQSWSTPSIRPGPACSPDNRRRSWPQLLGFISVLARLNPWRAPPPPDSGGRSCKPVT